jgi:PPOX class probable F420-dependent enzyme
VHQWARERFEKARVGRLATTASTGGPHLVPVVFALVGDVVWSAVDAKPKSTRSLRRLANIESNPRVSMLVDQYEDDWSRLWWVRIDGAATVVPVDSDDGPLALSALSAKYSQYAAETPLGPLIRIAVGSWTSWSARSASDDPADSAGRTPRHMPRPVV